MVVATLPIPHNAFIPVSVVVVMVTIREMRTEDAKDIAEVARLSWLSTYSHIFSEEEIVRYTSRNYNPVLLARLAEPSERTKMFVAEDSGEVVGFAQVGEKNYWDPDSHDPSRAELSRIYIHPQFMRRGIGRLLLDSVESWMLDRGFDSYELQVHKDNHIGRAFYSKHGFVEVGEPDDDGHQLMRRRL